MFVKLATHENGKKKSYTQKVSSIDEAVAYWTSIRETKYIRSSEFYGATIKKPDGTVLEMFYNGRVE